MPLTDRQRGHLERRLLEERERLGGALGRSLAGHAGEDGQDRAGDLSKVPFHPGDVGSDTLEAELAGSNEVRLSRELGEIDAALERLYREPARFGTCEDTGREIPFERLDVVPWARTCDQAGA
jgi:RNA polymerase-binding transcription factor DksA